MYMFQFCFPVPSKKEKKVVILYWCSSSSAFVAALATTEQIKQALITRFKVSSNFKLYRVDWKLCYWKQSCKNNNENNHKILVSLHGLNHDNFLHSYLNLGKPNMVTVFFEHCICFLSTLRKPALWYNLTCYTYYTCIKTISTIISHEFKKLAFQ